MKIVLKTLENENISLDVTSNETIRNVKQKVQTKKGWKIENQRFVFGAKELENNSTLNGCGISDDDYVFVVLGVEETKTATPISSPEIAADIERLIRALATQEPHLSTAAFRTDFENLTGRHPTVNESTLFVTAQTEKTGGIKDISVRLEESVFTVVVKNKDLVSGLKAEIAIKANIPAECQRLLYGARELADHRTVSFYEIKENTVVDVVRVKQIFAKDDGSKSHPIFVSGADLISSVKERIQEKTQIPVLRQRLIYVGKQLEDQNTVDFYNIQKDATIFITSRLRGGAGVFTGGWERD